MNRSVIVSTTNETLRNYWVDVNSKWFTKVDEVSFTPFSEIKPSIQTSPMDVFLIMHDDVFIYDEKIIDEYFELAQQGKVVTPFQTNYNNIDEVNERMMERYGKVVSFYPYFLFISRENLEKTRLDFTGKREYKFEDLVIDVDQGFKLAHDLLEAGVDFHEIPNMLGRNFPKNPSWIHAQGLSIGFLENMNVGSFDEYKMAWLIEILGMDMNKIIDTYNLLK